MDTTQENDKLSVSQVNGVVRIASERIKHDGYSKEALIDSIVNYYGYHVEVTESAIGTLSIDWTEQAVKTANKRLRRTAYSKAALVIALVNEDRYSEDQALAAVESDDVNWIGGEVA